jgi:CheY-like chemotaxis protein
MYVDDEPPVLRVFKDLVEPLGLQVVTLSDSREAALRINREKFDGVFVDARMPDPDGFELTKLVRESPSNYGTPIIMLTGYNDVETMRKGFRAGVTFFLGKPLTQSRLYLLLRTIQGAMLIEKKRYIRLPIRIVVTYQAGSQVVRSESRDLSQGGMLLETAAGVAVGQELDVEFVLPGNTRPLKPRVQVVRLEAPDRMAVRFVGLKTADLELIQEFVAGKVKE